MTDFNQDEELPIRSPLDTAPVAAPASAQDENDWSTLIAIHGDIVEQMNKLASVDGLDLKESEGITLKEQVAVNKKVIEVLEPIAVVIESAVQGVQLKMKGRYNGSN